MTYFRRSEPAGHRFNDDDFVRMYNYVAEEFFASNQQMKAEYGRDWQIDLVTDDINLRNPINQRAFDEAVKSGQVFQMSWNDFRARARRANEQFLDARDDAAKAAVRAAGSAVGRDDATHAPNVTAELSPT